MSSKEIVDRVLAEMTSAKTQSFSVRHGPYWLQVATGQPGSICFTLQEEVGPSVRVILAEGFTLGGSIVYDKCTLPSGYIEDIVSDLVERRFKGDRAVDTVEVISSTIPADI